ncbi:MBL fold metallo-hydrolase [Nakamurella lactea]|uniref:MBL fold metallo-hydrolase n=1 Tax=Nakamurella lactea TaxID=459515 RepID=UPI0004023CE2|nr:MBL fold metallo-hydrolase [Nakamurella lactea]
MKRRHDIDSATAPADSSSGDPLAARPVGASAASPQPRLTVLNDAFGKDPAMTKDWGYCALVEAAGRRILFDTGNSGEVLARNARAKGIDLSRLDFAVMSHRHGDHMGGLAHLLSVNPTVTVYAPIEGFGVYGSTMPASVPRIDSSLPAHERYFDGTREGAWRMGSAWPDAHFELVATTTRVAPDVTLIALVSEKPGTLELRELSMAIDTPEGIVLVVGCAHPGIGAIVLEATAVNPRIHCIAGGLHLLVATDEEIDAVVTTLHDTYRVEYLAPGHCTGEPTLSAVKKAFGDHYLYAGVGSTLALGATPGPR